MQNYASRSELDLYSVSESNSAPWWFKHALYELQVGSAITTTANMRRKVMPMKQHHLCPAFVCRQSRAKRDVLSSTTNLWPNLLAKSIKVSESRAECAVGVLEGLPLGPSWGLPACLFTLHLFSSTASILQLLFHTHLHMGAAITHTKIQFVPWYLIVHGSQYGEPLNGSPLKGVMHARELGSWT